MNKRIKELEEKIEYYKYLCNSYEKDYERSRERYKAILNDYDKETTKLKSENLEFKRLLSMLDKRGKVYIIRNNFNELVYIGITIGTLEDRFKGHSKGNSTFDKLMQEVGIENFTIELLEDNINLYELGRRELFYILKYDSVKKGYNIRNGNDVKFYTKKFINTDFYVELKKEGKTNKELADIFNVSLSSVSEINRSLNIRNKSNIKECEEDYKLLYVNMKEEKRILEEKYYLLKEDHNRVIESNKENYKLYESYRICLREVYIKLKDFIRCYEREIRILYQSDEMVCLDSKIYSKKASIKINDEYYNFYSLIDETLEIICKNEFKLNNEIVNVYKACRNSYKSFSANYAYYKLKNNSYLYKLFVSNEYNELNEYLIQCYRQFLYLNNIVSELISTIDIFFDVESSFNGDLKCIYNRVVNRLNENIEFIKNVESCY